MDRILQFDIRATQFINALIPHNQFFNIFFSFFSMIGIAAFVWIIIVLLLIVFEEKRHHWFIASFLISVLITAVVVNVVIKNIVQRPRPASIIYHLSSYICPPDFSFPSGHAAVSLAAAVVLAYFDKKRGWFYYSVAGIIGLSRIYLGCHFFLDVIGGGIIGYLIGSFVLKNRKLTSHS